MQLKHLARGFVQAHCPAAQFAMGAAALLASVAGQLDTIDGEHLPPDQALAVAYQQDLGEPGWICAASSRTNFAMCV